MEREFIAPGPGTWQLDTTHSHSAMTVYAGESFAGMPRGFKEGCTKYGLMISHPQPLFLHGFFFMQLVGFVGKPGSSPPPKFIFKMLARIHPGIRQRAHLAHTAFTERRWLQDLAEWDELKKDSIARNTKLQSVDLAELDDAGLLAHLQACRANAEEMVYRHHIYSVGAIMPIGWFLDVATRNSGLTPADVALLLKGSTPVSAGIAGAELARVADAIKEAGIAKGNLEGQSAESALAQLRAQPAIAAAIKDYLAITGYMLIGGYCISEKTLNESPNILMARILDALDPQPARELNAELEQQIRAQIPQEDRNEFDRALADARKANRLRDERGIYNDIWGAGVSRTAILEAGRRLAVRGKLTEAELLLDASHQEMLSLLRGESTVTEQELKERRHWRMHKSIDEVPPVLGPPPSPPPPLDWLPEKLQPTMRAFGMIMGNVFDDAKEPSIGKITGLPVSPGVYEGIAKVILSTRDFGRLNKGDVLITKNTSAGFNVVLPIIGALVTDRGGLLSHAAIVSREYGIPGVVSTKTGTQLIPDGARVRVDGNNGEVTVLS